MRRAFDVTEAISARMYMRRNKRRGRPTAGSNTMTDKIVTFAWTANHETADYEHYPPYVNLTGNRLAVRGPEKVGMGHVQQGDYVSVELPDEAIAELRATLTAMSTAQEPALATGANGQPVELLGIDGRTVEVDVEIAPIVAALNAAGVATRASCSGHGRRPANIMLSDGREIIIARNHAEGRRIDALFPNAGQERVDDDAEWLRHWLSDKGDDFNPDTLIRLEAIANRLQTKAPETDYCGIVVVDEAPETGEG